MEKDGIKVRLEETSNEVSFEGTNKQIKDVKDALAKYEDKDVCFEMTEDDYTTLLHISDDENWRTFVKTHKYEKGKALFVIGTDGDTEMVEHCIQRKLHIICQLTSAQIIIPSSFDVSQFPSLQSQVEDLSSGIFCFLSLYKKKILIKAESYESVQQAKHVIEVNLGIVQQGGGRRNRKFADPDQLSAAQVAIQTVYEPVIKDGMDFVTKEGIKVFVYSSGIGNLKVDTLVNAANKDLMHGGGIAYHISSAAGYSLEKECDVYIRRFGPLDVGTCCSTTAGKLPYSSIIHAVGPMWHSYSHDKKKQCSEDLRQTVISSLKEAAEQRCKSIAIPSISSGVFGVPREVCAEQYYKAVVEYSKKSAGKTTIKEIHFIDKDQGMCSLIQKTFEKEFGFVGQKM